MSETPLGEDAETARSGHPSAPFRAGRAQGACDPPRPRPSSRTSRAAKAPAISTAHRYLASFAKAGLVRQTHRAGLYGLAKGAAELGLAAISRMDLVTAAAERLEELVVRTGAAGLVAVWGPIWVDCGAPGTHRQLRHHHAGARHDAAQFLDRPRSSH